MLCFKKEVASQTCDRCTLPLATLQRNMASLPKTTLFPGGSIPGASLVRTGPYQRMSTRARKQVMHDIHRRESLKAVKLALDFNQANPPSPDQVRLRIEKFFSKETAIFWGF